MQSIKLYRMVLKITFFIKKGEDWIQLLYGETNTPKVLGEIGL
jgi:hypothetical protein